MTDTTGVLVVADGWLVDRTTADRLARQFAQAPAAVLGVAAAAGLLTPGTSYRVHAERCSLLPLQLDQEPEAGAAPQPTYGAVLLRDGVAWSAAEDGVVVKAGSILLDQGAYAHDPTRPLGPVLPAAAADRPPFPWRPVVAFLARATGTDDRAREHNEWARQQVNGLLEMDIEGRLALADPTPGRHLTRPCAPSDASVGALGPNTVVALDPEALHAAQHSTLLGRGTTVIELAPELAGIELVSWQIGRAQGRLRARVGLNVGLLELADCIRRLAAGPQPDPPAFPFATPEARVATPVAIR